MSEVHLQKRSVPVENFQLLQTFSQKLKLEILIVQTVPKYRKASQIVKKPLSQKHS